MEDLGQASGLACLGESLKLQHGADLKEGGWRPYHRDEGDLFVKLLAETDEERVDESAILHAITKLPEFITDSLIR